jgi:AcrR family transcriptional regulator
MSAMARRPTLSRDAVVARAVAFADRVGLDSLTMRSLAADLGVVPMALYKHVANRDDLIGAMIDAVVASYSSPTPGAVGKVAVRELVLRARDEALAHPWLPRAIEQHPAPTLAVLGHMDAVSGAFLADGLSIGLVHHAMHALGHRIWGYSPEAFDDRSAFPTTADAATMRTLAERYPHVIAIASAAAGGCNTDSEFEFTLDLLLEGIEQLHQRGWEPSEPY